MVDAPAPATMAVTPGAGLGATRVGRIGGWARFWWTHPILTLATVPLVLIAAVCLAAPVLPLADPLSTDIIERYAPPGAEGHLLGTDALGRDVLSRLIWGGRISIAAGIGANVVVTVISVVFGLLAGYFGGWVDGLIMRIVDVLLAFPGLLLALVILAYLGPSLINAVIAVVVGSVPSNVRFFRGQVLQARQLEFVDAARVVGASHQRIMFRQILPYVMPLIVTVTALHATTFFVATAGLSLLGLGVKPPDPDWGSMVGQGLGAIYEAPHAMLVPTAMITVMALCFNVIGDELQAILNPRSGLRR
jgi:peptide/nickel transport system permease protein